MSEDPLWEDLGYPLARQSAADAMRQMGIAAMKMSEAYRQFHEKYVELPPDLSKPDPAPDWK